MARLKLSLFSYASSVATAFATTPTAGAVYGDMVIKRVRYPRTLPP
jgi:hypothetical protein